MQRGDLIIIQLEASPSRINLAEMIVEHSAQPAKNARVSSEQHNAIML